MSATRQIKIFGVFLVASFILLSVIGAYEAIGFGGPIGALQAIIQIFIDTPALLALIVIGIAAMAVADRIADDS